MHAVANQRTVTIDTESGCLHGQLATASSDQGIVIIAAADGKFDMALSRTFNAGGLATLVLEAPVLASRLAAATDWLDSVDAIEGLPVGYLGAGMASAAVLEAAAQRPAVVTAVVLCDGRPLLAAHALPRVRAPTLSIVSAQHDALVRVNRAGLARLLCEKRLECVPGGLQLVDDASIHERVSRLAHDWFARHLTRLT